MGADFVILGDATGADDIAYQIAKAWDILYSRHKANWSRYGKRLAGPIRNAAMVAEAKLMRSTGFVEVECHAFPLPGSTGTYDCIEQLEREGFRVWLHAA